MTSNNIGCPIFDWKTIMDAHLKNVPSYLLTYKTTIKIFMGHDSLTHSSQFSMLFYQRKSAFMSTKTRVIFIVRDGVDSTPPLVWIFCGFWAILIIRITVSALSLFVSLLPSFLIPIFKFHLHLQSQLTIYHRCSQSIWPIFSDVDRYILFQRILTMTLIKSAAHSSMNSLGCMIDFLTVDYSSQHILK